MKPVAISEQLMFSTIRLVADNGICGTGYFYTINSTRGTIPIIITNKHVVNNNPNETMTFLIHLTSDGESEDGNYAVRYESNWFFHPVFDLCFTLIGGLFNNVEKLTGKKPFYKALNQDLIVTDDKLKELSMIESIVMIGYPNGLWDQQHNYPLFRFGHTASHPGYDFNEPGIGVIDAACFPGSSGSPILILNEGSYKDKIGGLVVGSSRIVFLGTLYAGPTYNADGTVTVVEIPTSQVAVSQTSIMLNLGYYIKASAIKDFESVVNSLI